MTRKSTKHSIAISKKDETVSIYTFNNDKERSLLTKNPLEPIDIDYTIINDDTVEITNIPAEMLEHVLSILTKDNTIVLYKCYQHYVNKQTMHFIDKTFNKNYSSEYEY